MRSRIFLAVSLAIVVIVGCWSQSTIKPIDSKPQESQSQPAPKRPGMIMGSGGGSSGGGGGGSYVLPTASTTVLGGVKVDGSTININGSGVISSTGNVASVFGRTGTVTATSGDYTVSQVTGAAPTASPTFTTLATSPAWSATGLTGATAGARFIGATAGGAPASGTFLLGDFVVDQTGKTFVCSTAGSPGTWTQTGSVYTLPTATNTVLGGVKPDGTSVLNTAGAISVTTTSIGAAPTASPTFTGQANFKVFGYTSVYANNNSGNSPTVNWGNGNLQSITLAPASGNAVTITFTAPTYPGPLTLYVTQDATGGRTVNWPTIKWSGAVPGVITTTASATDVVTLQYDGTSYWAAVAIPDGR